MSGCGESVTALLQEIDEAHGSRVDEPPPRGTYCGAAAALLVSLLEETECTEGLDPAPKDAGVVGKVRLIAAAAAVCEQPFVSSTKYADAAANGVKTKCAAAQQLASLCGLQYVKEMQRKKLCATGVAYSLTAAGRQRAVEIRAGGEAPEAAPLYSHRRVEHSEVRERERAPPGLPPPPQGPLASCSDSPLFQSLESGLGLGLGLG